MDQSAGDEYRSAPLHHGGSQPLGRRRASRPRRWRGRGRVRSALRGLSGGSRPLGRRRASRPRRRQPPQLQQRRDDLERPAFALELPRGDQLVDPSVHLRKVVAIELDARQPESERHVVVPVEAAKVALHAPSKLGDEELLSVVVVDGARALRRPTRGPAADSWLAHPARAMGSGR